MVHWQQIPMELFRLALAAAATCAAVFGIEWLIWLNLPPFADGSFSHACRPDLALAHVVQLLPYVCGLLALGRWLQEVKLLCLRGVD